MFIEEKLIDGKLSLEFSAEKIRLVINNIIISVNAQDDYILTRSLSEKDEIINKIRTLRYEVEESSNKTEENRKTHFLLQRMEYILASDSDVNSKVSKLKSWIRRDKWLFTMTSPFVMKIIELIQYMMKYSQ
ncbi:MAG: hypothetical protein ACJ72Q_06605 [Nitrososphaeraceae archaeon]